MWALTITVGNFRRQETFKRGLLHKAEDAIRYWLQLLSWAGAVYRPTLNTPEHKQWHITKGRDRGTISLVLRKEEEEEGTNAQDD